MKVVANDKLENSLLENVKKENFKLGREICQKEEEKIRVEQEKSNVKKMISGVNHSYKI